MTKINDFFHKARFLMNHETQRQLGPEGEPLAAQSSFEISDVSAASQYLESLAAHNVEWDEALFLQANAILQLERDAAEESLLQL